MSLNQPFHIHQDHGSIKSLKSTSYWSPSGQFSRTSFWLKGFSMRASLQHLLHRHSRIGNKRTSLLSPKSPYANAVWQALFCFQTAIQVKTNLRYCLELQVWLLQWMQIRLATEACAFEMPNASILAITMYLDFQLKLVLIPNTLPV